MSDQLGSETDEEMFQRFEVEPDDSDEALDADNITTYLPRGHIKIRKILTEEADSGELVPVEVVETINDSILEAAHRSILAAIQNNRDWSPEDILPELLCQEPFCYLEPDRVLKRVLKLWKDLTEKLQESPIVGRKRGKQDKYINDWMNKMEGMLMMLDGLTPTGSATKINSPSQQKIKSGKISSSVGSDERGGGSQRNKDDNVTRRENAHDLAKRIRHRAANKRSKSESSSEGASSQTRKSKRCKTEEEVDADGFLQTDLMLAIQMSQEIDLGQESGNSSGAHGQNPTSSMEQRMTRVENTLQEILSLLKGPGEKK